MTTFTSDDREEEYKKILAAAPNQPGYEDAVPIPPTNQTSKELMEAGGMIGVLREQICQQQAEIDSLRKNLDVALMMIDDLEKGLDSSIKLNKAQAERNNEQ